jgi:ubiquitin C-terminal hydrolase
MDTKDMSKETGEDLVSNEKELPAEEVVRNGEETPVPSPIPIPSARAQPSAIPSFSTQNIIDYSSGLTPPPASVGDSGRGQTVALSPVSSGGYLDSPMALNSPLSRSFGPVPIWADDSITYKSLDKSAMDNRDPKASTTNERGLSGLSNLGNTCFMNSALQCLCHTPQLMYAFLSGDYKNDLNTDNPLGLGGKLASAFGGLLSKLWKPSALYVTPKHFKFMLSKFAPQFSGYSQQDSQELLSFLLDGLHEDLNRIKDKPYKEEKDADGRPDEEVALEAWENYRARNDSVVVDTFQGLYKSTLKCPSCNYTSVKFDPFMYLSLPLPSPKRRTFQVTVVDQFSNVQSLLLAVRIPKAATVGDLIREIRKIHGEARDDPNGDIEDSEWALGQWNGRTMDLFLDETMSVESIPEKPNFVYSYFSSKTYKLYAYRYPKGIEGVVPPSSGARAVLVFHKHSSLRGDFGIPSLYFLPEKGCQELQVVKSDEDSYWEVQPDETIKHAMDSFAASLPDKHSIDQSSPSIGIESSNDNMTRKDRKEDENENGIPMVVDRGCTYRILFGTSAGHPKSSSYFSSSQPSIGPEGDISPVYLCAMWNRDEDNQLSVVREPVEEHSSVKILERQESLPFKATLGECLDCFCQPEQLDESDTWYCSKCKEHVRAIKKLDLWYLPPVLVIHLKRFSYSRYSRDKLDTDIEFPLTQLDLSGFLSSTAHATSKKMRLSKDVSTVRQEEDPVYDLYAVSNHFGGMGGGHYTAFCQMPDDQCWYDFDDSHVSEVGCNKVQSPAAYVLFYHRRGSDVGLANKSLEMADSVHHDLEAKACDSPRSMPLSPRAFGKGDSVLPAIPSSDVLMDL